VEDGAGCGRGRGRGLGRVQVRGRGRDRGGHGPVPGRRYELDGAVGRLQHNFRVMKITKSLSSWAQSQRVYRQTRVPRWHTPAWLGPCRVPGFELLGPEFVIVCPCPNTSRAQRFQ
jgi:hypothetical protein